MTRRVLSTVLFLLIMLAIESSAQEQRVSTLQKAEFPMLEYVNLSAELELESDMLRGFGARVDDARRSADAAALATQALVLSFAEEIAVKRAPSITAIQILEEAVRIAEEQQSRTVAAVISAAARRIPGSELVVARMSDSMALFSDKRGEGNFVGYIRVTNDCDRALDVYVDGGYKGFLFTSEAATYSTGNGTTTVRATDAFGNTATEIFNLQPEQTVTWTITP